MISDSSRFYGAVLVHLLDENGGGIHFEKLFDGVSGFFLINKTTPLYIKYTSKRRGPWTFNLRYEHMQKCSDAVEIYGKCVIAFVCGGDGVVGIGYELIKQIIGDKVEQQAVSVRRKLNHMYGIHGKNGELDRKISRGSLGSILLKANNDKTCQ